MDVKTVFLNGIIEEEVYIEQLEGFEIFNNDSHVCRLKRALYGLKKAPCAWYTQIDSYFTGLGFTKSEVDANLYQIVVEGKILIIFLYVDDLILNGDEKMIHSCKEDLAKEFEMKDMILLHYFLGLEIWQRDGELFVSQGKYAREILGKFHMEGLETHGYSSSRKLEERGCYFWRGIGCYCLSKVSGFANVSSEHETGHLLCN
jgi:hypothetical protein